MYDHQNSRSTKLTIAGAALLAFAGSGIAAPNQITVPVDTRTYRESVQCMPEVQARASIDASLEEQRARLVRVDLGASIDGDRRPDVLVFGAESYTESVACTRRIRDLLGFLGARPSDLPDLDLEAQQELRESELPDELAESGSAE